MEQDKKVIFIKLTEIDSTNKVRNQTGQEQELAQNLEFSHICILVLVAAG